MASGAAAFESALESVITFCLVDAFHERKIIHKKAALFLYENNAVDVQLYDQ
jgi:hypothetical protein